MKEDQKGELKIGNSQIILYQSDDGTAKVELCLEYYKGIAGQARNDNQQSPIPTRHCGLDPQSPHERRKAA